LASNLRLHVIVPSLAQPELLVLLVLLVASPSPGGWED
jgi:hypothetical protein